MMQAGNEVMTRYLLGQLDDLESRRLEEAFFADEEIFDQLQVVEGELIEAYLYNEMPMEQRRQFEQQLALSPRRRSRMESFQLLSQEAREAFPGSTGNPEPGNSSSSGSGGTGGTLSSLESIDPNGPVNSAPDFGAAGTGGDLPVTKPGRRTLYRALPAAACVLLALTTAWQWRQNLEQQRQHGAYAAQAEARITQLEDDLAATVGISASMTAGPTVRSSDRPQVVSTHNSKPVGVKVFVMDADPGATYEIRTTHLDTGQAEILTRRTLQDEGEGNWYYPLRWVAGELQPGYYEVEVLKEGVDEQQGSRVSTTFEVQVEAEPQP